MGMFAACFWYLARTSSVVSSSVSVVGSWLTRRLRRCVASPSMKWLPSNPLFSISL